MEFNVLGCCFVSFPSKLIVVRSGGEGRAGGQARHEKWRQKKKAMVLRSWPDVQWNKLLDLLSWEIALFHCEFSTNLLNWLTWIFLSSCSSGARPVFSTLQTGVCWCTIPVCAIFRPVTYILASWRSHSMDLRTEYIFITKYITMAIKTSNTNLIIPVVMIRIVALHFFTFTVGCLGMLHFLCFVSNRYLKGFSSKQYDKACKTPLTVPQTLPVTCVSHSAHRNG